jgi:hypothetical protein
MVKIFIPWMGRGGGDAFSLVKHDVKVTYENLGA